MTIGMGIGVGIGTPFARSPGPSPKHFMPGFVLQLDPDDSGIIEIGLGIDTWPNQVHGGTCVSARQTTNNTRPALLVGGGPNGHNGVEFVAATEEEMDLTLVDASHDYTVFAVVDHTENANWQTILGTAGPTTLNFHPTDGNKARVYQDDGCTGMFAVEGPHILTFVVDSSGPIASFYRDGELLATNACDATSVFGGGAWLGDSNDGGENLNGVLFYLAVANRVFTAPEIALVHAWLANRFDIAFSPLSVANCGAWWNLDYSTQAAGVLTGLTDLALADTINIVGAPAIVSIGGQDFVRCDGINDVLWIGDKAALDGALGNTHVLKHANTLPNPVAGFHIYCQKGRLGAHWNGGMSSVGSTGARFAAGGNSGNVADGGPLAEFTSPAEAIAQAFESGAAVRRVDGDGTYASTVTAETTTVGVGSLTWGARETGVGAFNQHAGIDLRAAAYYNRPLNQYELQAVRDVLETT